MGSTWHEILFSKTRQYLDDKDDGSPPYYENHKYSLIECCGCENISLIDSVTSNALGGEYIEFYPPLMDRRQPKWLIHLYLQDSIDNPYKFEFIGEIYTALKNNMPRLAVIGIRALLEQVMIENVGDNGTFKKNIAEFEKQGYISRVQKEAIVPVLEAGHASIHRGFKATMENVVQLMDVTENILESIYINNLNVSELNVPNREK